MPMNSPKQNQHKKTHTPHETGDTQQPTMQPKATTQLTMEDEELTATQAIANNSKQAAKPKTPAAMTTKKFNPWKMIMQTRTNMATTTTTGTALL